MTDVNAANHEKQKCLTLQSHFLLLSTASGNSRWSFHAAAANAVKSDIPASCGLLRWRQSWQIKALFAYFIVDKLHTHEFNCFRIRTCTNQCTEIFHFMYWAMLNSFSNLQIDNTTRTTLVEKRRTKTLSSTIVSYRSLSIMANILLNCTVLVWIWELEKLKVSE